MSSLVVKKKVKVMSKMKGGAKKPVKPMPATIENSNFDLELCWCIQQLQNSLQSGKLSDREGMQHMRKTKYLLNAYQ